MIAKERKVPIRIQLNETLLRRLPKNHPKRSEIESDLTRRQAGYKGEQTVDHYLKSLSEKDYLVFQDLRLPNGHYHFQIDTLILSSKFALLIEVKNISGTLFFDRSFNQLIRTANDKEEGFPDPLSQVDNQQFQFNILLETLEISDLPLGSLIVISKPATILKTRHENSNIFQRISHVGNLTSKIREFTNKYTKEMITSKELGYLHDHLLRNHTDPAYNILKIYGISKQDILSGLQCPECSTFQMARRHGVWECLKCRTHTKEAHLLAISDYFALIDSTITNLQFREFLHLSSPDTGTYLLKSTNLPFLGTTKGRIYHRPLNSPL
ncbi:nuclease-related domain-containing protein [Bacillus sp. CECT 9360]|uniref:nuclease-related domain-containing protein n=1 Tax=Bacillus sp. CECT 9360 TaxID=2845821 RepID=UPI001E354184|nr:nuclease-related domain-containing protein [Bacillus sp. CECT 9360]CAH0345348.1 hypothetical protein BCI9360_01633 [Bacillus sp. CECT 9360]